MQTTNYFAQNKGKVMFCLCYVFGNKWNYRIE